MGTLAKCKLKKLNSKVSELKNAVLQVVLDIIGEAPIPLCLRKTITKFYLTGVAIIFISIVLMVIERSFRMNWFGLAIGLFFIISGLYLTRQYKLGRYDVIEGTCLEIKLGAVNTLTGKLSGNRLVGEKRKYIIKTINGSIIEVHSNIKNDRIQKDMEVAVYVRQHSLMPDQTEIYNCLAIDAVNREADEHETTPAIGKDSMFESEE